MGMSVFPHFCCDHLGAPFGFPGLNLFEPRYLLMCQRLATDPRFLFMSNYEDRDFGSDSKRCWFWEGIFRYKMKEMNRLK